MNNELIGHKCQKLNHPLITAQRLKHRVVVYIRQSSEAQVEQHTGSTEYQRKLAELALAYGWQPEQIILIEDDLGRSGTGVGHRPGWTKMEQLIVSGTVKVVIAANTSRLSRNLIDLIQLFALAARYEVVLIVDNKVIDPRDDHDIFVSRILGSVAEYENKLRAETMMRARLVKAQRGEVVFPLPTGLLKLDDGTVIKNPDTKDVIELVIATFWQKRSLLKTVRELRARGVKLPSRGRRHKIEWREPILSRVSRILLNPGHAGIFAYRRSEQFPDLRKHRNGRIGRRPTSPDRWVSFFNRFPAYMSPEQQEEIKNILRKNSFSRRERPGRGSALTQGLLVCARCGAKLTVSYGG